jgi:hypothetical protein
MSRLSRGEIGEVLEVVDMLADGEMMEDAFGDV